MAKRKRSSRPVSEDKLRRREEAGLVGAAALVGVPEAQRAVGTIVLHIVPQLGNEPTPIKHTVRRLTRIEQLVRSGVLEPHEGAACEKYADWHQAGFEAGLGVTANYEGRSGGGSSAPDLLARHKAQMMAREDYAWARTFIPKPWLRLFEDIVLGSDTIGDIASQHFERLKSSQAGDKTRAALKLCANLLHTGIAPLLPIDAPAIAKADRVEEKPAIATAAPVAEETRRGISLDILESLLRARIEGRPVDTIVMAPRTLAALERDLGTTGLVEYQGLPVWMCDDWAWGYVLETKADHAIAA